METNTPLNTIGRIKTFFIKHYCILIILFMGAFLRLFRLDFQSLWLDEIYTLNISNPGISFKQINADVIHSQGFPYLYFYVLRWFYALCGYSSFSARLFSVLCGTAAIYMIYVLGKHLISKNVGLLAAFVLAVNEFNIQYSQEARSYSLYVLVTIVAFYRLSVFIKNPNLKNSVWYGLSAALLLNINFFSLLNVFSQFLILLLYIIFINKELRPKLFWLSALAGIISLLLFIPNYAIIKELLSIKSFWVPLIQPDTFSIMFKQYLGNSEITMFVFGMLFILYAVTISKMKARLKDVNSLISDPHSYSFIILFIWFTGFFSLLYVRSYTGTSLGHARYFISLIPVFILVIAIAIDFIKNYVVRVAIVIVILSFSLINLIVVKKYYIDISKTQFREVSSYIQKNNANNKVYTSLKVIFDYYLNNNGVKTTTQERSLEDHVRVMMADSTHLESFWYTDGHIKPYQVSPQAEAFLNRHFIVNNSFDGFDAWARFYEINKGITNADISKFKPVKAANGDPINYFVETFTQTGTVIEAKGFAYFYDQDATYSTIKLLLINNGQAKTIPSLNVYKPDVTAYFKLSYNANNSGFATKYDISALPPGEYTLGIYMVNKVTKKEGLVLTDKKIIK